jgi:hypothetical protein
VREAVLRAPKAAVDIQQNGMRSFRGRQAYFEKLIWIRAIGHALIGWRLRFAKNIFGGHRVTPA